MIKHTNEPWNAGFFTGEGFNICANDTGIVIGNIKHEEDRDRIVSCVNACADVTDEQFAGGWTAKGISDYAKSLEQRDMAWSELREIREVIVANPEESTADEARRVVAQRDRLMATLARMVAVFEGEAFTDQQVDAYADAYAAVASVERQTAEPIQPQLDRVKLYGHDVVFKRGESEGGEV